MDTLVVGADDRLPVVFQRKFLPVPATNLLVAGTGRADLINGWFNYLHSLHGIGDVDDLNAIAPAVLKASAETAGHIDSITTTLYHFGFSKSRWCYVGYAYRSVSDFNSESLPYALGLKPQVPVQANENIQFPDFLVDIVVRQQAYDRMLPIKQQLGIGGEIEFAVMSNQTTRIETVHRFPSYESEKQHIKYRAVTH